MDVEFLWKYLGEYKPKKQGFVKGQAAFKCSDVRRHNNLERENVSEIWKKSIIIIIQ